MNIIAMSDARMILLRVDGLTLTSRRCGLYQRYDWPLRRFSRFSRLAALFFLVNAFFYPPLAVGQWDDATIHENGHDVTFHADGMFVVECRCVSAVVSALCINMIRAIAILESGDRDIGVERWEMRGRMRSGAHLDMRQVCYLDDRRQEVPLCCTKAGRSDFESVKGYYGADLKSTEAR